MKFYNKRVSLCCRLPQYIYPGGYIAASPSVIPMSAHSPLSPSSAATAGQVFDYSAAGYPANLQAAAAAAATFEGYPYATAANYMTPGAAAYTYAAAVPQNSALAGFTAAYQPQQIQERMQ